MITKLIASFRVSIEEHFIVNSETSSLDIKLTQKLMSKSNRAIYDDNEIDI